MFFLKIKKLLSTTRIPFVFGETKKTSANWPKAVF
jgi:hypothetical protein